MKIIHIPHRKKNNPHYMIVIISPYLQGGNPLDFKFGNAASVSVQSTSLTDQQAEHFVTR